MRDLTAARARQLFSYDALSGDFTWKFRPLDEFRSKRAFSTWNAQFAGKSAGQIRADGYQRIGYGGSKYLAHRLAWLVTYGEWPERDVDHINGLRSDNRLENLRAVSRSDNLKNRRKCARNTSGVVGVYWDRNAGKWHAQICSQGVSRHLGLFDTFEAAVARRKQAEQEFSFHPNHGRAA